MNIVLEGPDSTGKSTLAEYLSERLGRRVIESPGRPTRPGEIHDRLRQYEEVDNAILVRHPAISQPIYAITRALDLSNAVRQDELRTFYESSPLIIYCCRQSGNHKVKSHDRPDHLDAIERFHAEIVRTYDHWAREHAQVLYRIGDDKERIVAMCKQFDPVADVEQFHHKFGIGYRGDPRALEFEVQQFRLKFLREELGEYETHTDAMLFELDKLTRAPSAAIGEFAFDPANLVHHLASSLDALVDLMYVTLGTAHLHGFNFREAWRRVHAANMAKTIAEQPSDATHRLKLKITKPPGWEAPKHDDLVENNIHRNQAHRP